MFTISELDVQACGENAVWSHCTAWLFLPGGIGHETDKNETKQTILFQSFILEDLIAEHISISVWWIWMLV